MIYLNGVADHKIDDKKLVDHIVELVEMHAQKITELQADGPKVTMDSVARMASG